MAIQTLVLIKYDLGTFFTFDDFKSESGHGDHFFV